MSGERVVSLSFEATDAEVAQIVDVLARAVAEESGCAPLIHLGHAAEFLSVSTWTVERLVADGSLRSVRVLGARRIPLDALVEFRHQLDAAAAARRDPTMTTTTKPAKKTETAETDPVPFTLARKVSIGDERYGLHTFAAGDSPPEWAARRVTAPSMWREPRPPWVEPDLLDGLDRSPSGLTVRARVVLREAAHGRALPPDPLDGRRWIYHPRHALEVWEADAIDSIDPSLLVTTEQLDALEALERQPSNFIMDTFGPGIRTARP